MKKLNSLLLILVLFSACTDKKSPSVFTQEPLKTKNDTEISEFTPFHPDTGLPLTKENFDSSLIEKEEDYYQFVEDGDSWNSEDEFLDFNTFAVMPRESDEDLINKDSSFFSWTPSGEYNNGLSEACHFSSLEKILNKSEETQSQNSQELQAWSNLCQKELSRGKSSAILTALRFDNVNYETSQVQLRSLQFIFEDRTKLNGLLLLRDNKKRPLVIFKTGLYGDARDSGVFRNFLMHSWEESPFHFLFLGNVTGGQFAKENGDLYLGGFDEGRQIVKVAQDVMSYPDIANRVVDIHAVGVSLGSHGVLFSGLYSSFLPDSPSRIKSNLAFCPVVNLEPTMKSLFDDSIRATFYEILTLKFLRSIFKDVPIIGELINLDDKISRDDLYKALKKGTVKNYIKKTSKRPWDLKPFDGLRITSEEEFWHVNNYIEHANLVKIPTLVIHAKDDFLVQSDFNSFDLEKKIKNSNSQIGVVSFENGSHCGFNVALGWPTISSIVRSHVLKYSEYKNEEITQEVLLPQIDFPYLPNRSLITKYFWNYDLRKDSISLEITYFDPSKIVGSRRCAQFKPLFAAEACYQTTIVSINPSFLNHLNIPKPTQDFEALRFSRWMNSRGYLINTNGKNILGTKSWPSHVVITSQDYLKK